MSKPVNTDIDHLATLPTELIEQTMTHMDTGTILNIARQASKAETHVGKYRKVIQASYRRMSVAKYYDTIFGPGNGVKVLTAMARNLVYMSGSMAAEFHCPGIATSDSDCDFYIVDDVYHIYNFMNALADTGVTWWTAADAFTKSLKKTGDEVTISTNLFRQLQSNGTVRDKMSDVGVDVVTHGSNFGAEYCTIAVTETSFVVEYHNRPNEYALHGTDFHIIRGEMTKGNKRTLIQLMCERRNLHNRYGTPALMNFHSSCVQSFIGPCSAGHMYVNPTAKKEVHGWTKVAKRTDKHPIPSTLFTVDTTGVEQWNKFENRGYKYVPVSGNKHHCVVRHMMDSNASYIEYSAEIDVPLYVKDLYMAYSSTMTWFETTAGLTEVLAPINVVREHDISNARKWLSNGRVRTTVCVAYLRKYMPDQIPPRDITERIAGLVLANNESPDDTDDE